MPHDWKIIIFDLDGTLTESKAPLQDDMGTLLCKLLSAKKIAVMGGGNYGQFTEQFLNRFNCSEKLLANLLVLPTSGASMYRRHSGAWEETYRLLLSNEEKKEINRAFEEVFRDMGYESPGTTYGDVIEDRGTQITFSALGQKAPLAEKEKWHRERDVRPALRAALQARLPSFTVTSGGLTSIDPTKKGIDKGYGVEQAVSEFGATLKDAVFVGDALFEGGNDYAVVRTGIDTVAVSGSEETKRFINSLQ